MSAATTTEAPAIAGAFERFLAQRPELAHGIFGQAPLQGLGDESDLQARRAFAAAWERKAAADAEAAAAERELQAAVRLCRSAGAQARQLAALCDISPPTLYSWLRGCP